MLYNMFAGMMRGIGNSFITLVFLIISTVCNAILDVVFVGGIGMGNLCRSCICRLSLINEKNEGAGFGLYYFLGNGRKKNGAI